MKARDIFDIALTEATALVDQIEPDDYPRQTPDEQWNVKRLASHVLYELCWVRDMVQGKTIAEVGNAYEGDLLGNAPAANWHAAAEAARRAVRLAGLKAPVHTSFGDIPVEEYLMQISLDLLIHAWDLAKGLDVEVHMDPAASKVIFDYIQPQAEAWRKSGAFGPELVVAYDADIQSRLLALTGRDPAWHPKRQ